MEKAIFGGSLTAVVVGSIAHAYTYINDSYEPESVSYKRFVAESNTGDLILTSGTDILTVSRLVTRSMWTHCGILYIDNTTGRRYEWSSHSVREQVANTAGTPYGGAQLVPLDYLVADNGALYWRKLDITDEQRTEIRRVVRTMAYKVDFSSDPEFAAFMGGPFALAFNEFGSGVSCSHLVATTYMAANIITHDRNLTQNIPDSFSDAGDVDWLCTSVSPTKLVMGFDTSRLINLNLK